MANHKPFRFRLITLLGLTTAVALAFGSIWGCHNWKLREYDRLVHDGVRLKDSVVDSNWREYVVTGKSKIERPWMAVIVIWQAGDGQFLVANEQVTLERMGLVLNALKRRAKRAGISSVGYQTIDMDASVRREVAEEAAKVALYEYGK
jgi:hypothetical protein